MGLRFQKRIRLFKGLTLNLSKTGVSWTLGGPGAAINLRGKKVTGTIGAPGTGLSYRETLLDGEQAAPEGRRRGWRIIFALAVVLLALYWLLK